jgi:hypothetical protein
VPTGNFGGIEYGNGSREIGFVSSQPVLDAALHGRDRGEMKAPVHTRHRFSDAFSVGNVAQDQVYRAGNIVAPAGRKIVEHAHSMATLLESLAQV